MTSTLFHNAGAVLTGDIVDPIAEATAVLVADGVVTAIGPLDDVHPGGDVHSIDLEQKILIPGLIDAHTHPVLGDYTPRQFASGWIESYVHGGVTTLISAGEPHTPGRPRDPSGVKALALLAHKSYLTVRPGGATVHAGALLLEPGLTESDFAELAAEGCFLVGEIGISGVTEGSEAAQMARWAQKHGFIVPVHFGGASVVGSSVVGASLVLEIAPDVVLHCNGGPTAPPLADVMRVIDESDVAIEVVQAGNIAMLQVIVRELVRRHSLHRLQIGSDTPSGTGVIPLAILRTMAYASALGGCAPELAIAAATGSTARRYRLDSGRVAVGSAADLVVLDAPRGSAAANALDAIQIGDTPAVAGVFIAGECQVARSRVTPPPRTPLSLGGI